jgi:hypothetical protein
MTRLPPSPFLSSAALTAETLPAVDPGKEHLPAGSNIQSSCGGVKESPVSTSDYNGVKSPALVTAHGLSRKSCPLSRSETGPQETRFALNEAAFMEAIELPAASPMLAYQRGQACATT